MNKIRLVAFDLDGTIGDTIPLCIKAFKEAVAPYIGHELSDDDVIRTFGLNEQGMIASLVDAPYKECALADFYTFYKNLHEQLCPRPFPGIRELITDLKQSGIIVALVTGKGAKSIQGKTHWIWRNIIIKMFFTPYNPYLIFFGL